jgi:outer membrane protein assembly factor BamB
MKRRTLLATVGIGSLGGCLRFDQRPTTTAGTSAADATAASGTDDDAGGTGTTEDDPTESTTDPETTEPSDSIALESAWSFTDGFVTHLTATDDAFYGGLSEGVEKRAVDGTRRWRRTDLAESHRVDRVAASDDLAAVGLKSKDESTGMRLVVLDDDTGNVRFAHDAPADEAHYRPAGVALAPDTVVLASQGSGSGDDQRPRVTALDRETGDVNWTVDVDDGFVSGLVVHDDHLFVTVTDQVLDVDLATGTRTRTHDVFWGFVSPTVADGTLYAGNDPIEARTLPDFAQTWQHEPLADVSGQIAPLATDRSVVFGTDAGHVAALDRATGDVDWETRITSKLLELDRGADIVWALDDAELAYAIDLDDGTQLSETTADDSRTLAAIDDLVVIGGDAYRVDRGADT